MNSKHIQFMRINKYEYQIMLIGLIFSNTQKV